MVKVRGGYSTTVFQGSYSIHLAGASREGGRPAPAIPL